MKKREFLSQGGALASGVVAGPWLAGSARAHLEAAGQVDADLRPAASELSTWRALQGERFDVSSPLGRTVSLRLVEVDAPRQAHADVEQFRLMFEGPRHLPLPEGLHELEGGNHRRVVLHLQPVRNADGMRYHAHFSLLA